MKKLTILAMIAILASFNVKGQDVHFSQFSEAPLFVNPSLAGVFNGDIRFIINYKDQWKSIATPYRTYALSGDWTMFKKKWKNSFLGAGMTVYRDLQGDVQLGTTKINLSLASILTLNDEQRLSVGLQGGFAQRSINANNMMWDSQFDGQGYDPTLPTNETFAFESSTGFGDFAGGISWNYFTNQSNMISNDKFYANIGAAFFHINRPEQFSFYETDRLYGKIVVHGNTYIGLKNSNMALLPSAMFMRQGPHQEILAGMMVRYILKEESKYTGAFKGSALSLGAQYRFGDAAIPMMYLETANFGIGVSYDVNVSQLKAASSARGGIEISLRFINPNPFTYGKGTESNVRFL